MISHTVEVHIANYAFSEVALRTNLKLLPCYAFLDSRNWQRLQECSQHQLTIHRKNSF